VATMLDAVLINSSNIADNLSEMRQALACAEARADSAEQTTEQLRGDRRQISLCTGNAAIEDNCTGGASEPVADHPVCVKVDVSPCATFSEHSAAQVDDTDNSQEATSIVSSGASRSGSPTMSAASPEVRDFYSSRLQAEVVRVRKIGNELAAWCFPARIYCFIPFTSQYSAVRSRNSRSRACPLPGAVRVAIMRVQNQLGSDSSIGNRLRTPCEPSRTSG
jgi:hypothetical protein